MNPAIRISASRRGFLRLLPAGLLARMDRAPAVPRPPASDFQVEATPLFARVDGRLKRMLAATIKSPDTAAGSVRIMTQGRESRVHLATARHSGPRFLLPVDPVDQEVSYEFVYTDPSKTRQTHAIAPPERHWQLYIVHNSHQDPGFLKLPSEFRAEFLTTLDEAVRYCEQTKSRPEGERFKWNIEVAYLLEDYRRERGEKALAKVIELIKSGAMELGALYCSINSETLSVEPMYRLLHYAAANVSREFGIQMEAAILDDVPGYAWGLMDALAQYGIRYFVLSGNRGRSNLWTEPTPHLYYSEGPAGGRTLVFRPYRYYEGIYFLTSYRGNQVDLSEPEVLANLLLDRYRHPSYPYDSAFIHTSYDFIHPMPELCDHIGAWNRAWEYPRMKLATLSEFFRDVEARHRDKIPVLRAGFPDAWNDCRNTVAQMECVARRLENELPDSEKWATLAHASGMLARDYFADLDVAYKRLLMFEEHTLGWGGRHNDIYADESEGGGKRHYAEKAAHAIEADRLTAMVRGEALSALSRHIPGAGPDSLLVWNPLSWPRTDVVHVPAKGEKGVQLLDPVSGQAVPSQSVRGGAEVAFVARDIPSVGYRNYRRVPGGKSVPSAAFKFGENEFEGPFYKVRFDPFKGAIASLTDKQSGLELVDPAAPHLMNQLVYVISRYTGNIQFEDLAEIKADQLKLERQEDGPVLASMKVRGEIESILKFEQEVILYTGLKRVDLITRLRKKAIYTKEGLYLAFPFRILATRRFRRFRNPIRLDIAGGFMRPEADQLPGSGHDSYIPQHVVVLNDTEKGVFWASRDAPVVQFGGIQTNRWRQRLMADRNYMDPPSIYSFLLHNYWETNSPNAQGGDFQFRYSFTTAAPQAGLDEAKQFGWGFLSGMAVSEHNAGAAAGAPRAASFASAEPPNIAIAAIKRSDDGRGIILRLAETAGLNTTAAVSINLPGRVWRQAWHCDPREIDGAAIPIADNTVELNFRPFEIRTVRALLESEWIGRQRGRN